MSFEDEISSFQRWLRYSYECFRLGPVIKFGGTAVPVVQWIQGLFIFRKRIMMDLFLKIAGIVLAIAGAVIVFAAKAISKSRGLADKQKVDLDIEGEALTELKLQKAVLKIKMIGGAIFLPGMLIILYAFR